MNKQNGFFKVGLTVGLLFSLSARAEYGSAPVTSSEADFDNGVSLADTAKDLLTSTPETSSDNAIDKLQETVEKIGKAKKRSEEEQKLRKEVGALEKEIAKADKWIKDSKVRSQKALEDRAITLKQAEDLAGQLAKTTGQIDAAALSSGDLPKLCKNGVNIDDFRNRAQAVTESQTYKEFRKLFQDALAEQQKGLKEKVEAGRASFIADLAKNLDDLASLEQEEKADRPEGFKFDEATLVKQLAKLKRLKAERKEIAVEKRKSFVQLAMEELAKRFNQEDKDKQLSQVATQLQEKATQDAQDLVNSGVDVAKNLKLNCDQGKQVAFSKAIEYKGALSSYLQKGGDRPDVAEDKSTNDEQDGYMVNANKINKLSCRSSEDQVVAAVLNTKGAISTELAAISTEKNPLKMLGHVDKAAQLTSKMGQDASVALIDAKEDCKKMDKVREKFEQKIAQVGGGQGAGGAGAVAAAGPRTSSGRSAIPQFNQLAGGANHTGAR